MTRANLIKEILKLDSCQEKKELEELTDEELEEIYEDLTDESRLYPNGRDYEAEDEG